MIARSALVLAVVAVGACGDGGAGRPAPVSDSVYVEVMARLVTLDTTLRPRAETVPRPSNIDSLRQRILDSWGVDSDALLDYARTRGRSPEHMQAIWQRIDRLSDSLGTAGWSPADVPADSVAGTADTVGNAATPGGGTVPPDGPPGRT